MQMRNRINELDTIVQSCKSLTRNYERDVKNLRLEFQSA